MQNKVFSKTLILVIVAIIVGAGIFWYYQQNQKEESYFTDEDIRAELSKLKKINAYPKNKSINLGDYPKVLGKYSKNGLTLIESYFCSDVCPDAGSVSIVFQGITSKEECEKINGIVDIDPAWGGFKGCSPNIE